MCTFGTYFGLWKATNGRVLSHSLHVSNGHLVDDCVCCKCFCFDVLLFPRSLLSLWGSRSSCFYECVRDAPYLDSLENAYRNFESCLSIFKNSQPFLKIGLLDTRIPTGQLRKSRDKGKEMLKVEEGKMHLRWRMCALSLVTPLKSLLLAKICEKCFKAWQKVGSKNLNSSAVV